MTNNFEGVDPEVKKQINEEGFEGDKEGGAAVIIGKKEEMPQLEKKLETEGNAPDVASYIRIHKEIALPKEEMGQFGTLALENKGLVLSGNISKDIGSDYQVCFIDGNGNLARIRFDDFDKIYSVKSRPNKNEPAANTIAREMEKLGFRPVDQNNKIDVKLLFELKQKKILHEEKIAKELKEKQAQEFNF